MYWWMIFEKLKSDHNYIIQDFLTKILMELDSKDSNLFILRKPVHAVIHFKLKLENMFRVISTTP